MAYMDKASIKNVNIHRVIFECHVLPSRLGFDVFIINRISTSSFRYGLLLAYGFYHLSPNY